MNDFILLSAYWGVFITVTVYLFALYLKRWITSPLLNPILFSVVLIIGFLIGSGIDYELYMKSTHPINYLLTPATVALALPLYEQLEVLKKHRNAIFPALVVGVLTSLVTILAIALVFRLDHQQYVTLLPKSITTAIGISVSQELNGLPIITTVVIIATGIFGNVTAELMCKLFRIKNPVAKGLAIGASSHALGTAKAFEMGPVEGAISSLAIVIAGVLTVLFSLAFAFLY